jgi:hypothetical protein
MLFRIATLRGIADGSVTCTFRRWDRPRANAGSETRTALGVVVVDSVDRVALDDLTDLDAVASGAPSLDALIEELSGPKQRHPSGDVYRIGVRYGGPDPRAALREHAALTDDELAEIVKRLARLDKASTHGAWTGRTLALVAQHPARRAADLAEIEGRDTQPFKLDVRKLKNLGLTESLDVGYRISPRGETVLSALLLIVSRSS